MRQSSKVKVIAGIARQPWPGSRIDDTLPTELHGWPARPYFFVLYFVLFAAESLAADWTALARPGADRVLPRDRPARRLGPEHRGRRDNLVWKQPYGYRSTPLVVGGKMYIASALDDIPGVPEPSREARHRRADRLLRRQAPARSCGSSSSTSSYGHRHQPPRLGAARGRPREQAIYAHTYRWPVPVCLDGDTGQDSSGSTQLTEEFGRVTGYGGRVGGGPIFDSGLVIVGIVNASWGSYAPGPNRLVAFDTKTGEVAWWGETPSARSSGRTTRNPVVAVIDGQRLMIYRRGRRGDARLPGPDRQAGVELQVSRPASSTRRRSSSATSCYVSHGEENPEGGEPGPGHLPGRQQGDGRQAGAGLAVPRWHPLRPGLARPSPTASAVRPRRLGQAVLLRRQERARSLWKYNYGTIARGSPLIADGKIYISEVNAQFHIIQLEREQGADKSRTTTYFSEQARRRAGSSR